MATNAVGEQTILLEGDSGNANFLLAQNITLSQSAIIQSLSFYVTSAFGKLRLGVYDSSGPNAGPGKKKAETGSFTPVLGWNTKPVMLPVLLPAGKYWLAYVPSNNALAFRKGSTAGVSGKYYPLPFGLMPNAFSTSPSSTPSHWSLYANFGSDVAVDAFAPSIPANLDVSAALSGFYLRWSPSTDDVGVVGYDIFRDGVKIGTTQTPSYSDVGIFNSDIEYAYVVKARDSAGNSSGEATVGATWMLRVRKGGGVVLPPPPPPPPSTGWTTFTASVDTQVIYCSQSTGSDGTAVVGDINHPYKTIAAAKAQLRNGKPDWLLLKKGDTWTDEAFGAMTGISGRSATEPMLLSSYGTGARPLLKTNPTVATAGIAGYTTGLNFTAIAGIEFYAYKRDPSNPSFSAGTASDEHEGVYITSPITWTLFEDCKFSFYGFNIVVQPAPSVNRNVTFRRCVIVDAYEDEAVGHSQGIYCEGVTLTLIENVFDHNGWNATAAGAGRTIFNRNFYIHKVNGFPATVTGNICVRSSSEGGQLRPGGTLQENFFSDNSAGFDVGVNEPDDTGPATTLATISNNVIMNSDDIDGSNPRGAGINLINSTGANVVISNNIISHCSTSVPNSGNDGAINIGSDTSSTKCLNNRIFSWPFGIIDDGAGTVISGNDVDINGTNNNPGGLAPHEPFPDPNRSITTYLTSLGISPATKANFYTLIRAQSKDNWNPNLLASAINTYIRAGFGL